MSVSKSGVSVTAMLSRSRWGLGQRIGALHFDRVLSSQHEERHRGLLEVEVEFGMPLSGPACLSRTSKDEFGAMFSP